MHTCQSVWQNLIMKVVSQKVCNFQQIRYICKTKKIKKWKLYKRKVRNFRTRIAQRSMIGRDFEEMSRNFNEIGMRNPQ